MLAPAVFLLLVACGGTPAVTAPMSDPGWTTGQVHPCDSGQQQPHYVELRPDFTPPEIQETADDLVVAVAQVEGQWWLWADDVAGVLWRWPLDQGVPAEPAELRELMTLLQRFSITDLDGDGALDLLAWGSEVVVLWSVDTDHEQLTTVLAEDELCLARMVIQHLDLDGDGDQELIVPLGLGCGEDATLVLSQGDGRTFGAPVAVQASEDLWGGTFATTVFDQDGDGHADLYLCNDFGPETAPNAFLFGDGAGGLVPGQVPGADIATYCMSTGVADLSGDGRLDLYMATLGSQILLVDSDSGYYDAAVASGLASFEGEQMAWGAALGDLDNDGRQDVVLTTDQFAADYSELRYPWQAWLQDQDGHFEDRAASLGLPQQAHGRGLVILDLNEDGVLDLVGADLEGPRVLLSEQCTEAAWIEVEAPAGSRVEVQAGGRFQVAIATERPGFAASRPAVAHLGLGSTDQIDLVRVVAPGLAPAELHGPLQARQRLRWSP